MKMKIEVAFFFLVIERKKLITSLPKDVVNHAEKVAEDLDDVTHPVQPVCKGSLSLKTVVYLISLLESPFLIFTHPQDFFLGEMIGNRAIVVVFLTVGGPNVVLMDEGLGVVLCGNRLGGVLLDAIWRRP